ncbi:TPA: hypothetical protein ACH3X1_009245 [Trebouxia sp. C0004]
MLDTKQTLQAQKSQLPPCWGPKLFNLSLTAWALQTSWTPSAKVSLDVRCFRSSQRLWSWEASVEIFNQVHAVNAACTKGVRKIDAPTFLFKSS